jgi:hypothetical protein
VIDWAVPGTDPDGGADCFIDEGFRLAHGFDQRHSLGDEGGDGRGVGAAGAVGVAGFDAWRAETVQLSSGQQQVDGFSRQMPSLEQHVAGAHRLQPAGGLLHLRFALYPMPGEGLGFRQVRGEQIGVRQELPAQGGHRFLAQQGRAPFGEHDRIDYRRQGEAFDGPGDGGDDFGRKKHAGFDDIGANVFKDRRDLLFDEFGRHRMDAPHAAAVLGGQGGNRAHPVAAE